MVLDDLYQQFTATREAAADSVWRRFREQMPDIYFQETDLSTQLSHLHLLAAGEASGVEQDLVLRSQDGNTWTFLTNESRPGQLGQFLTRLPADRPLTSVRAYTSRDGHWVIDVFEFTSSGLSRPPAQDEAEHLALVEAARRSGNLVIDWEPAEQGASNLRIVIEGSGARGLFERVARYLGRQSINIERAYVTTFGDSYHCLGYEVHGARLEQQHSLGKDIQQLHYLGDRVWHLWDQEHTWSLRDCEVLHFLISLAHQLLVRRDPLRYARSRLEEAVVRNRELSQSLLNLFGADRNESGEARLPGAIEQVDREEDRIFFETCRRILESIERHNLDLPGRRSLAARVAPTLFFEPDEELPFAVFYAVGRGFEGFHVRFQEVARGGMRLVCPRSSEAHSLECERVFREAYALAGAQHLKNKDIPEGGAKAVVLVEPEADVISCGQAFADALLDLTLGQRPECLYLGPDENVSNELIEWIDERAARRGHPFPSTFMSSKPGAGINHKAYGITSEGLTVCLEVALRQAGIEPETTPFTVTITGGPDGDVAGNEIRILLTRYAETARILGVADGSGSAEDPDGLDAGELLRLVAEVLPIAHFDRSKLGPRGQVVAVTEPGGVVLRNTLHNRIRCDAFVPAGGRPGTINEGNWEKFLGPDGVPACPLIVEGANLFLTDAARKLLSQKGVTIIKDSSANKCGVICSSFEILASMLLTEAEFLENKAVFVAQVIDRLRQLARLEAELLFQERRRRRDLALPELSVRLSVVMLKTAEAVAQSIADPLRDELFGTKEVLLDYLPPILREKAGHRVERIPLEYRQRIVACTLAGKIVYREGITYLEDLLPEALQELAIVYLAGERSIGKLIAQLEASDLPDAHEICRLLEVGGARTLTRLQSH